MKTRRRSRATIRIALLTAGMCAALCGAAAAQYSLSAVEVRLVREPAGGCLDPCVNNYSVTVRCDGSVEYDGLGFVDGLHTRTISPDDAIALVNEFLAAQFFNALPEYTGNISYIVRNGDTVRLYGSASADDPHIKLTLHIGPRTKTVILRRGYPKEFGRLVELVDAIGGPQVWR